MMTESQILQLRFLCSDVIFDFEFTQFLVDNPHDRDKIKQKAERYINKLQSILDDAYVPDSQMSLPC
jgi:hypothetical protein